MLREIVLDTETTGLDAKTGDRLIEIGCVEILNRIPTGDEFHAYINPETREVHPQAEAVQACRARGRTIPSPRWGGVDATRRR